MYAQLTPLQKDQRAPYQQLRLIGGIPMVLHDYIVYMDYIVYVDYFLPSLRFHLTVNDTCSTYLKNLAALTDRYLKKWTGLPHPGTLSFIHMPQGLNCKSISTLYLECHTNS